VYNAGWTYNIGSRVQKSDGTGWKCIADGTTGVTPGTDVTKWLPWGHTDTEVDSRIDTRLGTVSGMLADGTVTPTNSSVVTYVAAMRFPNSSNKLVSFRLALHNTIGGYAEVLTLSGGAVFAAGLDGGSACFRDPTDFGTLSNPALTVKILTPTTAQVTVTGVTPTGSAINLDVTLRGH